MENIIQLIESLRGKDNKIAYKNLQILEEESQKSNSIYQFFDEFVKMMEDSNSYVRTRGMILISQNARWDIDNKVDDIIDDYLTHIVDEKPITARQCIKSLERIIEAKEELIPDIQSALYKANLAKYKDTMRPLIEQDISDILKLIHRKFPE